MSGEPEQPEPEQPAEAEPEHAPELDLATVEERRYPSTIGGAVYLLVLLAAAVGIGIVSAHEWRLGVRILAGSMAAAGALRLVLPQRDAGMLAVRHRLTDVVLLVGVAAALVFLAGDIPDQPA